MQFVKKNDAWRAALLLALGTSVPVHAQEAQPAEAAAAEPAEAAKAEPEEAIEEIIVTGIRHSLQRSLDMKREATGVVDVISAEDIGKFPDSNVAASLQRVPGISIQRAGTRGEATGITVRGFGGDFNETLVDGRRISTAVGERSVDLVDGIYADRNTTANRVFVSGWAGPAASARGQGEPITRRYPA